MVKLISFSPQASGTQRRNLLCNYAMTLSVLFQGLMHSVDRLPVGLVDGAPSLQLSGGLAGVHPVPVDGSLEESRATWPKDLLNQHGALWLEELVWMKHWDWIRCCGFNEALRIGWIIYMGHRGERVLCFFSSRRNWDSPTLSHAGEYVPPFGSGGGEGTLARGRGSWRGPIPTMGQTLWYSR